MPNIEEILRTTIRYRAATKYGIPFYDDFDIKACANRIEFSIVKPSLDNNVTEKELGSQIIAVIKYAIYAYEDSLELVNAQK